MKKISISFQIWFAFRSIGWLIEKWKFSSSRYIQHILEKQRIFSALLSRHFVDDDDDDDHIRDDSWWNQGSEDKHKKMMMVMRSVMQVTWDPEFKKKAKFSPSKWVGSNIGGDLNLVPREINRVVVVDWWWCHTLNIISSDNPHREMERDNIFSV